jgi:fused signal recognition particle receptor
MEQKISVFQRLKQGLSKTRDSILATVFSGRDSIDDEFYEALEEALIMADVGMELTESLLDELRARTKTDRLSKATQAREALRDLLAAHMTTEEEFLPETGPAVLLIVGVNGVGKTTSIGKLAYHYQQQGKRPMLAAADTFRAAAAEQLGIWAERAGVPMVRHGEGADPAAVVFDAIASFKAKGCDLLICDTAGRLHNKKNLMNELEKIRRVIARELPDAPCRVLLVLDATTGQNAIAQAKAFGEAAGLTDVVLTKLDGTAKGGMAIAVKDMLELPVRFVGVGEALDDLQPFDAQAFAAALLGE